jgi:hypothetical protein
LFFGGGFNMARDVPSAATRRWRERIERQERSDWSIAEFCAREGVSSASFYVWRRRLFGGRRAPGPSGLDAPAPVRLIPVRLPTIGAAGGVEIVLPNGAVVRLPALASAATVAKAIRAAGRIGREEAPSC